MKLHKKLLPHERKLLESLELINITHARSSSIWLEAKSTELKDGYTNVYRPMGDTELLYLLNKNALPNTQPYQSITADEVGRMYAEKYLNGAK